MPDTFRYNGGIVAARSIEACCRKTLLWRVPMPREIIIPIGPSIAYVPLTQGLYSLIDREDAKIVTGQDWFAARAGGDLIYAKTGRGRAQTYLHRILLGLQRGDKSQGDHKNHDTLDNRRSANLRKCTASENVRNMRLSVRNTTGFKGVNRSNRAKNPWNAQIRFNRVPIWLGSFSTREAAYRAYCDAARRLYGEFADFGTKLSNGGRHVKIR